MIRYKDLSGWLKVAVWLAWIAFILALGASYAAG